MPKCYFNKFVLQSTLPHVCSPVNLLYIFRTTFLNNTSGKLVLTEIISHQNCASAIKDQICFIGIQSSM